MSPILELLLRRGIVPRRVSGTHGGEYHSPCPVCGGRDRFHVWPARAAGNCPVPGMWGCRGCDTGGDAIAFLRHCEGLGFVDACRRLQIPAGRMAAAGDVEAGFTPREIQLPPEGWRERAASLTKKAHSLLLRTPMILDWLADRGIDRETAIRHRLGWLCRGDKAWISTRLADWQLPELPGEAFFRYPRGLLIPRFAPGSKDREVVAMRIRRLDADRRRFAPEAKYMAFKGSAVFPLLLLPDEDAQAVPLVVVESELDAMLVDAVCRSRRMRCGVLGLASNTARPDTAAHRACREAPRLLLCLDMDPPGSGGAASTQKALAWWKRHYAQAVDWPVPIGKDPGEAFGQGLSLPVWIAAGLPADCRGDLAVAPSPMAAAGQKNTVTDESLPQRGAVHGRDRGARSGSGRPLAGPQPEPGVSRPSGSPDHPPGPALALPVSYCEPPKGAHPDIRVLWELMRRYPIRLGVREYPALFAVLAPVAWKRANWERYARILDFIFASQAVDAHLARHPVREGAIGAHNFLLSEEAGNGQG